MIKVVFIYNERNMKLTFENSFPITAVDYLLTVMNQSGYVGI